jgi:hypothetical protein
MVLRGGLIDIEDIYLFSCGRDGFDPQCTWSRLSDTGLFGELEVKTRLIEKKFASVMCSDEKRENMNPSSGKNN